MSEASSSGAQHGGAFLAREDGAAGGCLPEQWQWSPRASWGGPHGGLVLLCLFRPLYGKTLERPHQ